MVIGNQSRPNIFALNIVRPLPLYSKVVEIDERVTLVGYTSDPKYAEHAVKFDEEGRLVKGYTGVDHDPEDRQDEIVKGLSGEAVKILKKPG